MKTRALLSALVFLAGFVPLKAQNTLWINDPNISWNWQSGTITEASLSVHPKGLNLEYGLYLTFSASSTYFDPGTQLEVVLDFQLPKGAVVLDSWLWVGNDIIQGKLIDRWSASDIYEGIVNRRRDPSVLFKNSDIQYQLRVYPLKKEETRKVKITYLMPADWMEAKIEASIPGNLLTSSYPAPDLNVFVWEEKGFTNAAFNDDEILFQTKTDSAFGSFKHAVVQSAKLWQNPLVTMEVPVLNGIYLSVFEDHNTSYYQLALSPGSFINLNKNQKILLLIDYEVGNSSIKKSNLIAKLKQQLLANYGPDDSFNIMYSKLRIEQSFGTWKPINAENLDVGLDPLVTESMYSNLPGLFSSAFEFLKTNGGTGSVLLITNSDNFGNYEQANALLKDLKKLQDPLPPIFIADIQDQMLTYHYIGNRYYYGQEYLYLNLSKSSAGFFRSIRDESSLSSLLSSVTNSIEGMVTAFDIYTAPADGFCYGRFGNNTVEGFPVNQTVTQIGKFLGKAPFVLNLTGLYQNQPFQQLVQVTEDQILKADTMLAKMWHGRYIGNLEQGDNNNMIVQEILYESLNNRVLSVHSAFLCLEPSDSISVCQTCNDESRLTGIGDQMPVDSTDFVKLYPNPFSDKVTMEISVGQLSGIDEVVVNIFNLTGQLVFEKTEQIQLGQKVTTTWQGTGLNGDRMPAGQYIVIIRAGQVVWSKKLMKTE
jgi:Ca-activated chloride channel family protein